ncbi:MAG: HupE/UreJ family protein [Synechococcaceae cyanobacterium]|jgi:urease accessory protein|nr:HupE/UreJ family protein [Synechococcaceae cyanobacterium]
MTSSLLRGGRLTRAPRRLFVDAPWCWLGGALVLLSCGWAAPASAHHLMGLLKLPPSPLSGLLSGLAHPVLGPDHLLFLLALSLVGLRHRAGWMLGLLATSLAGSLIGLLLPGLPGAEGMGALTLVLLALVLLERLPRWLLPPAFALHGYLLSASVIGWTAGPVGFYLLGLLLCQGALLLLSLTVLRRSMTGLSVLRRQLLAGALLGLGAAWSWSALVG